MENGQSPSVIIRQAALQDLPILRELWFAMLDEQRQKPFYPFAHEDDDARMTGDLATVLQSPLFAAFLAFGEDGEPIGFCAIEQQERRFGAPRYYIYFHGIYTLPRVRTFKHVPVAVRLCLTAIQWAKAHNLDVVECDNPAGYPPWWKGTLPFKATCTHYVAKVEHCEKSLSVFGKPAHPPQAPSAKAVTLEDLPLDDNANVES